MDRDECINISFLFNQFDSGTYRICPTSPHYLVSTFTTALEELAALNKAQKQMHFFEAEATIKMKVSGVLEQLNRRHSRAKSVIDFVDDFIVTLRISSYLSNSSCKCKRIKNLIYRSTLNVEVMCCQPLDSTVLFIILR